jgi:hypothetical protein
VGVDRGADYEEVNLGASGEAQVSAS